MDQNEGPTVQGFSFDLSRMLYPSILNDEADPGICYSDFLAEVKYIFSYNLLYISVNKRPFALVIFSILLQSKMDFQSFEDKNE